MNSVIEKIKKLKVVPVIVLKKAEDVLPLGEILIENGLPVAEITFRSDAAEDAIKLLKSKMPDMLIGAGTLLNTESIQKAADAGCDFFVSPGFNPVNVAYAREKDLLIIPGVNNPTHVEQAMDMGLSILKFFPAAISGGVDMLKAFGSVYPEVSFMPTGGINADNINDYLSLFNVSACGGSWMVSKDLIESHEWDTVARLVKEAVSIVQSV